MIAAPEDFLSSLPELVAVRIKARLPALRTCEGIAGRLDIAALKRIGAAAPAVLVSRLRLSPSETNAGPLPLFTLQMAAFVLTRDVLGNRRDFAEGVITQALLTLIPSNTWGLAGQISGADRVTAEPLVTAESESAGIALAAVTWTHQIGFGPVPEGSIITPELYVSGAIGGIDAGDGHELVEVTP